MEKIFQEAVIRLGLVDKIYQNGEDCHVFYYNEGYCVIEDGYIEGVFTNDRLEGVYSETGIRIIFTNNVNSYSLICSDECLEFLIKTTEFKAEYVFDNSFELPKELLLICSNNEKVCINIEFISEIHNVAIQEEILQSINDSRWRT